MLPLFSVILHKKKYRLDINEDFSFSGLFSDAGLCNCKDSENEFVIALTKRMDVVSVVFWYCQKANLDKISEL